MNAILIKRYGGPEVLEIGEVASPKVKTGQLLVQVKAVGLNPKDILIRKGKFRPLTGNRFPKVLGNDYAGVVVDSGKVEGIKVGTTVFGMTNRPFSGGAYAEYLAVRQDEWYPIPPGLDMEAAAGVPLVGQTALSALRDLGKLEAGQTVCINGASGGVGTMAIQIAKILGAEVYTISSGRNCSFCQALGADVALDYTQTHPLETLMGIDLFFDVFGNYTYSQVAPHLSRKGIFISALPQAQNFWGYVHTAFRKQKAKVVIVKSRRKDLAWLAEHLEKGTIQPVVDSVFPVAQIQEAHRQIETKRSKGKVIVRMDF